MLSINGSLIYGNAPTVLPNHDRQRQGDSFNLAFPVAEAGTASGTLRKRS
jgi:hypothetical protein